MTHDPANIRSVQFVLNGSNPSARTGMDTATTQFTDRMGLLFEAEGQPRIAGRLFGCLMVSDEPRSLGG